ENQANFSKALVFVFYLHGVLSLGK
ncbi:MAG: hypothetical protein RL667_654, partial [Pseudomonadota bacterium]